MTWLTWYPRWTLEGRAVSWNQSSDRCSTNSCSIWRTPNSKSCGKSKNMLKHATEWLIKILKALKEFYQFAFSYCGKILQQYFCCCRYDPGNSGTVNAEQFLNSLGIKLGQENKAPVAMDFDIPEIGKYHDVYVSNLALFLCTISHYCFLASRDECPGS